MAITVSPAFASQQREQPGAKIKDPSSENADGWGIMGCKQRIYTHNNNCGWVKIPTVKAATATGGMLAF